MLMMENVNNVIFLHGKIFQSVNPDMNAVVHGQDAPRAPQLAAEKKQQSRNINMGGLCRPHASR